MFPIGIQRLKTRLCPRGMRLLASNRLDDPSSSYFWYFCIKVFIRNLDSKDQYLQYEFRDPETRFWMTIQ